MRIKRRISGVALVLCLITTGALATGCDTGPAIVSGQLTLAGGVPAANAGVYVYSDSGFGGFTPPPLYKTKADANGDYEIPAAELGDGTYRIGFGLAQNVVFSNGATSWSEAPSTSLSAASPQTISYQLPSGGLGGVVTDGTSPIAGATVQVIDGGTTTTYNVVYASTTTNSAGAYSFAQLPIGIYRVRAIKAGYTSLYVSGTSTAVGAYSASYSIVSNGLVNDSNNLALGPESTVSGVAKVGSEPAAGEWVIAYNPSDGQILSVAGTDDLGNFTLTGLSNFAYTIGFFDPSKAVAATVYGPSGSTPQTGTQVTPPAGGNTDIGEVDLAPVG